MNKCALEETLNKHEILAYRYYPSIGSTNDEAMQWISTGAPEYGLVIADTQTSGRGRNGRTWITTPGASIALSIILHPTTQEQERLGIFSLAAGLAVVEAIDAQCDEIVQVKWPNDVLIGHKKTAGILSEAVWTNTLLQGVVIGIGINILKKSVPLQANLRFPATCLQNHMENDLDIIWVIDRLLKSFISIRPCITHDNFYEHYMEKMAFINQNISLQLADGKDVEGKLEGIDRTGNLLLCDSGNHIQAFPVGDISLRPA